MKSYIFILLLISIFLLFFHLNERPLLSSGEARASEIAVEMLARNNIFIPYLNEDILLTKPVLFHWLIILSYKLFGISEFAGRILSVISGILVVLLVYLLGKQFWGAKVGFFAGLILVTSPLFFWSARCVRIDALLLLLITSSLYCFWQGYTKIPDGKKWFLGWFFFMGLGFFSKGPVGLAVPIVIVVVFLISVRKYYILKQLNWFWGIIIFFAIVLPWYGSVYFLVPHYKSRLFFLQQNATWASGNGEYIKFFAYIPHLFVGFFPWSIFIPLVLIFAWREFKKRENESVIFLWIWFLVVFLMFSFLGKKVSRYILPLYPAISLLIARYWIKDSFRKVTYIAISFFVVVWIMVLIGVNQFNLLVRFWPGEIAPLFIFIIEKHINLNWISINIISLFLIIIGLLSMLKDAKRFQFAVLVVIMAVSLVMFIAYGIPIEKEYYSPKPFCEMMKEIIPASSPLCAYKSWDNTIRFYFGRHVKCFPDLYDRSRDKYVDQDFLDFINSHEELYCLMWEKVYANLAPKLKERFEVVASGYRVKEKEVVLLKSL